jgi:putative aldouronate transport system substrate-binding protein
MCLLVAVGAFATGSPEASGSAPGRYTVSDIDPQREPLRDPYERYDPPIQVELVHTSTDAGFWFDGDDDIENNIYTRTWLERLGIEMTFKWTTTSAQGSEKMNIMMSSGDLPDMVGVNEAQFQRLHQAGRLNTVTDGIVEYATPFTKSYLTGDYQLLLDKATRDDQVYGIGSGSSFKDQGHMLWIRADWLEAVGLSEPTTVAELEAIMHAFVHDDPDGNGVDDTYAIALGSAGMTSNAGNFGVDKSFFTMFGSYPGAWIEQPDGTLQDGMFGQAYRDQTTLAMGKLHEYYEAGYLHPDFATFDDAKVNEEVANGHAGIYFSYLWAAWWPLNLTLENNPNADWVPVPVPSYQGQGGRMSYDVLQLGQMHVATTETDHPEALVKMTNLYHRLNNDPVNMEFSRYNVGPGYNQIFLAYPLAVGNPAWNYEGYEVISEALRTDDPGGLSEAYREFYDQLVAYPGRGGDVNGWMVYRSYTPVGCIGVVDTYIQEKRIQFNEYTGEPTETMIYDFPSVKKTYDEAFFAVVLDGDFPVLDDFYAQYDALYGDTVTQEVNDWYQANGSPGIQRWFEGR